MPKTVIVVCAEATQILNGEDIQHIPLGRHNNAYLISLVDRPFLQHVIEGICRLGIEKIHVLSSGDPIGVRDALGDGSRWGCLIEHNLLQSAEQLGPKVASLGLNPDEPCIVFDAHFILPEEEWLREQVAAFNLQSNVDEGRLQAVRLFGSEDSYPACVIARPQWAGQESAYSKMFCSDVNEQDQGVSNLLAPMQSLSCLSGVRLLAAQEKVLTGQVPLLNSGYQIEPGVWMSRNVVLHPTAQIIAPVFLGENCRIDAGVQIGPNVALASSSRVAKDTVITQSAVVEPTWVGEGLHCEYLLLAQSSIWNIKLGSILNIRDTFLLSAMLPERTLIGWFFGGVGAFLSRLVALLLSLPLLCVSLVLRLGMPSLRGGARSVVVDTSAIPSKESFKQVSTELQCEVQYQRLNPSLLNALENERKSWPLEALDTLQTPVSLSKALFEQMPKRYWKSPRLEWQNTRGLQHFIMWFCPGIWQVVLGHWSWVGVQVRSPEAFCRLDSDWQNALKGAKPGLINVARLEFGCAAYEWEYRLSELFFLNQPPSLWNRLRLLSRYPRSLGSTVKPSALR